MPKFNIESAGDNKPRMEQRMIWLNQIEPDEFNSEIYNVTGIEALADDIKLNGLLQFPLVRYMPGGKYMIISGHRRVQAIRLLAKEEPNQWNMVPVILDPEKDETAAHIKLISANAVNRELSQWEIMQQTLKMHELLTEQKEKDGLPGRVRDMVAKKLNMSTGTVGEYLTIHRNLIKPLKEQFKKSAISKALAMELSRIDPDKQEKCCEMMQQGITLTAKEVRELFQPVQEAKASDDVPKSDTSARGDEYMEDKHEEPKEVPDGNICGNAENEHDERIEQGTQADFEAGRQEERHSDGAGSYHAVEQEVENVSESDTKDNVHNIAWYQDMMRFAVVDMAVACQRIRELGHGCSDCPLNVNGCTSSFNPRSNQYMLPARRNDKALNDLFMEKDW